MISIEKFYTIILSWIRRNKQRKILFIFVCKRLPYISAIFYIGILLYTIVYQPTLCSHIIGIPSCIFITVTIVRKLWNRPRPYEVFNITPLFQNKLGESTPSRHTASAVAIATAGMIIHPTIGIILTVISILIAFSRIIAGVHFFLDIFLGFMFAFIISILFITIFPIR